ncbi:TIGR04255 family protein [Bosea sp. Root670]|uniref:TIGR04255 family protein n=1 Tax=Bosea sp. Root670 TaxID=1736583 RepID=UPI00138F4708|nr:TIGR04255 family protein [Bosea sp. Root670]
MVTIGAYALVRLARLNQCPYQTLMIGAAVARPEHLPEFQNPPLDEVVIGIQFEPNAAYQQIFAGEVWGLFRDRFPKVEEKPPLQPVFETFGPPTPPQQNLQLFSGASHDRFWFLTNEGEELLQFQHDRFLHNWRRRGNVNLVYPRFEPMLDKFAGECKEIEDYFNSLEKGPLAINQCELSYINILRGSLPTFAEGAKWLRFLDASNVGATDDFNVVFRKVIERNGGPIGRLYCNAASAVVASADGGAEQAIRFDLTVRGVPAEPSLGGALEFMRIARDIIVQKFATLTTDSAHEAWGRLK